MDITNGFTQPTRQALKCYVYGLVDPSNSQIFYVGKANANNRAFDHLKASEGDDAKSKRIAEIRAQGMQPRIDILRYGLDEESVFDVEAAVIDTLGLEHLTNQVRGHGVVRGRLPASELERLHGANPLDLDTQDQAMILFFVSRTYSPTLSEAELYDNVRQYWRVGPAARSTEADGQLHYRLAVGVADGVAVAVYSIAAWLPANSTLSSRKPSKSPDKWEFVGQHLPDHPIMGRRLERSGENVVATQNGFTYVPSRSDRS